MKYIYNSGRYAYSFEIEKNGRTVKLDLDCRRIYQDTGNVATTGITEVDDKDYEQLCKNKIYNKFVKEGIFTLTDSAKLEGEKKAEVLEKENKELKKKLKEAEKVTPDAKVKKELEEKDKTINDLKAQLEALKKGDKTEDKASEEDKEAEGF